MKKSKAKSMMRKTKNSWLIKLALTIGGGKKWKELDKVSKDCRSAQFAVLMDMLDWAKDTEYGKEHNFSEIKTFDDFQKSVPLNTYEDLEPLIKRHRKGEENILFPGKPVIYATTSGTTKEPKWIPVTQKYYDQCYSGLSALWFYSLMKECPKVFEGPELSIVAKPIEGYAEDGTPHGSLSGHMRKYIPKFLQEVHGLPDEIYSIPDYASRYYCIMRICLEQSLRLMIIGNPSSLLELQKVVDERLDEMIEDIEKGTFRHDLAIPENIRPALENWKTVAPNPIRAEELRELKKEHGRILPKHYWPELMMINTWKCGNSGLYLKHTEGFFPENIKIREFSYLASEVRAGIVLTSDDDSTILSGHLVFFEFIKKEERDEPNAKVYLLHELEDGQEYYIFVTTPGGLYRYDMNDIVRVQGFYNEFPRILFIQKGAGVTSLTGEKLHETQLIHAIAEAEKDQGVKTEFFIGFADFDTSAYHVFAEFDRELNATDFENFRALVDQKLREINVEYEAKRASLRLKDLVLHTLKKDAFENFKSLCMQKGYRDGQFKLTHLMVDEQRMSMFKELERK